MNQRQTNLFLHLDFHIDNLIFDSYLLKVHLLVLPCFHQMQDQVKSSDDGLFSKHRYLLNQFFPGTIYLHLSLL